MSGICPGRHLADSMVWIGIVRLLAVFDVQKAKDADGNVVEPNIEFTTSLTRFVWAFSERPRRSDRFIFPVIPNRSLATSDHDRRRPSSSLGRRTTYTWQVLLLSPLDAGSRHADAKPISRRSTFLALILGEGIYVAEQPGKT